jgi:16S rRNA (uracil1498-N3)-methyltransferase
LRYRQIAVRAALTSGNEFIAEITEALAIEELDVIDGDNIFFYEKGAHIALPRLKSTAVQFIIGAEGGFTQAEAEMLIQKGFTAASPFPHILKAETAGTLFCGMIRARLAQPDNI